MLGAGANQINLIQHLSVMRVPIVTVDGSRNRLGHMYANVPPIIVDLRKRHEVVHALIDHGVQKVVTTGSELGLRLLAHCAADMNLPNAVPRAAVETCSDKRLQSILLKRHGAIVPRQWSLTDDAERWNLGELLGVPSGRVIVKPVDMWGGIGVRIVDVHGADFRERLDSSLKEARVLSALGQARVEEFIEGAEFGINVRIELGRPVEYSVTRKFKLDGESLPSGNFPVYARLRGCEANEPDQLLHQLAACLVPLLDDIAPTYTGSLNVDVIWNGIEAVMLEFTFRAGGNGTALLGDLSLGTRQLRDQAADALGSDAHGHERLHPSARRLLPLQPGRRPISLLLAHNEAVWTMGGGPMRDELRIERLYMQPGSHSPSEEMGPSAGGCLAIASVPQALSFAQVEALLPRTVFAQPRR